MPSSGNSGVRLLVAGLPRSGTTWTARMLASCGDTALVSEPDNPNDHPFALRKRRLPGGYYTALSPADEAPDFERLWQEAFGRTGGADGAVDVLRGRGSRALFRRDKPKARAAFTTRPHLSRTLRAAEALAVPLRPAQGRHIVVKTVYAPRCLEWIADRVDAHVVVVRRDLRSVVSSWMEMWGLGAGTDNELEVSDPAGLELAAARLNIGTPPAEPLERTTWLLAVLDRLMTDAAARHPDWAVVPYESLLDDPVAAFRSMARGFGLPWTSRSDDVVLASNRSGIGFDTHRIAARSRDVWRTRLTPEQEQRVSSVLAEIGTAG